MNVGDVVQLKSGGPFMTVVEVDAARRLAACAWFDKNGAVQQQEFNFDAFNAARGV